MTQVKRQWTLVSSVIIILLTMVDLPWTNRTTHSATYVTCQETCPMLSCSLAASWPLNKLLRRFQWRFLHCNYIPGRLQHVSTLGATRYTNSWNIVRQERQLFNTKIEPTVEVILHLVLLSTSWLFNSARWQRTLVSTPRLRSSFSLVTKSQLPQLLQIKRHETFDFLGSAQCILNKTPSCEPKKNAERVS